jgi:uncharacterized membrane protein YheB (UPF0754 family)
MEYRQMFDLKKCKKVKTEGFESYLSNDDSGVILSDTFAMNIVEDNINNIIPITKDEIQDEILKLRGYDNNYVTIFNNLLDEYTDKYLDVKIEKLFDDIVRDSCLDSGDITLQQYNKIENFKVLLKEFISQNL